MNNAEFAMGMWDREGVCWPDGKPVFCIITRDGIKVGFTEEATPAAHTCASANELYTEVEDVLGLHDALKDTVRIEWGPERRIYATH